MLGLAETVLETYKFSIILMVPFLPDEWGGLDPGGHAKYGDTVAVASAANLLVFAISIVGASAFAKASFFVFLIIVAALAAAIASFFVYTPVRPPALTRRQSRGSGPALRCLLSPQSLFSSLSSLSLRCLLSPLSPLSSLSPLSPLSPLPPPFSFSPSPLR